MNKSKNKYLYTKPIITPRTFKKVREEKKKIRRNRPHCMIEPFRSSPEKSQDSGAGAGKKV